MIAHGGQERVGGALAGEWELVQRLRRGDEAAFTSLLEQYHAPLLRLAMVYVPDRAVAEEVVQDTWIGMLKGLEGFEGRSSLKTWLYSILLNKARSTGRRESNTIPFSAYWNPSADPDEPTVDPEQFTTHDPVGHWVSPPQEWSKTVEEQLLSREMRERILAAINELPPSQKEVITLRDIEGLTASEACDVLGVSEANQRVLLHRARSKVRRAIERYLEVGGTHS
ncbi:MAG: sigma-70 family RNA polymerase sigma factor [Chloroflexi bacterium]|nr:sigma-70 family RNA polymerase sigma factor [Chloroflexota bacterium]